VILFSPSSNCVHLLSKEAVEHLSASNKKNFSCPVPGCRANWAKGTYSVDNDTIYRMERFFRFKNTLNQSSNEWNPEEEITQILDD